MVMYEYICSYMGIRDVSEGEDQIETAVQLIRTAAKHPSLKNELYMQLIKQSRNVPEECRHKIWELWLIVAAVSSPDKVCLSLIDRTDGASDVRRFDIGVHPQSHERVRGRVSPSGHHQEGVEYHQEDNQVQTEEPGTA